MEGMTNAGPSPRVKRGLLYMFMRKPALTHGQRLAIIKAALPSCLVAEEMADVSGPPHQPITASIRPIGRRITESPLVALHAPPDFFSG
jgi:hypothetical protein